ncbi:MAG TPA: hypothetical protein DCR55_06615 [Lentisphaeria bacterium]|nr:hypothetical protein [Lentisphaeria bacterium]
MLISDFHDSTKYVNQVKWTSSGLALASTSYFPHEPSWNNALHVEGRVALISREELAVRKDTGTFSWPPGKTMMGAERS